MLIHDWAQRWGIPPQALQELLHTLQVDHAPPSPEGATTEQGASKHARLQAANAGDVLWRNNVGQVDPNTYDGKSFIRFGLANDSKQMNQRTKSSDLIGIRKLFITQQMVGMFVGQFVAREMKRPGWKFTGNKREEAQLNYLNFVLSMGGDACFSTGNY